jgi:hypothetical protein
VPLPRSIAAATTEVAGDGRARVRIRSDHAKPAAPIRGALSYPATWDQGRWKGEAVLVVIPQWSWGYELDLAVSAPASMLGRIRWTRRRLGRLAESLAAALRDAAERSGRTTQPEPVKIRRPSAGAKQAGRWGLTSATITSASR